MTIVIWPHPKEWGTDMYLPTMPADWVGALRRVAPEASIVTPADAAEALTAAPNADVWIGRLSPEMFAAAKNLRWVQSPTIGVENLLFPELIASRVEVTNMRFLCHDHVANHAL